MTWRPIATAPKYPECPLLLACFRPTSPHPLYVVSASWGTAFPGTIQCASYAGWFVDPVPVADPPNYRGVKILNGVLDRTEFAPTHWRPIPSL